MPEQPLVEGADLRITRPRPAQVVLAGLPPVHARRLSTVLQAGQVDFSVVSDTAHLAVELAGTDPRVVVAPRARLAGLLPPAPPTARHALVALVDVAAADVCADLLRAGVTGVLAVDDADDEILIVVRCAALGRTALPRDLVRSLCRPAPATSPTLSSTERAWLRRLAAGGTVAGLARSCGYSEREMYRQLSSLYLSLGARSRTEALLLAGRYGLLDDA